MNLKVNILKKFRKNISARFNPRNAVEKYGSYYIIGIECSLCRAYQDKDEGTCSADCPFKRFSKGESYGCSRWLVEVSKVSCYDWVFSIEFGSISWNIEHDKKAREQIFGLRRKAKELIKFVD